MPINWGLPADRSGNLPVAIQDQHTQLFDFRFALNPGTSTVATATTIESRTMIVADASTASVGDYVVAFRGEFGVSTDIYIGIIQVIAVNTLTLDTPINYEFQIGDVVLFRDANIHLANGSVTPAIYDIPLPPGSINLDVTRIIFTIVSATEPDDSLFGDVASLANGCVIRHNSANYGIRNIWNFKNNGQLAAIAYDVVYTDKAGGGAFGTRAILHLAGSEMHGVTIRMQPGDKLELVVQDDLTDLNSFHVVAQGHVVD